MMYLMRKITVMKEKESNAREWTKYMQTVEKKEKETEGEK
jgi:hypothetical protein